MITSRINPHKKKANKRMIGSSDKKIARKTPEA